MNDQVNHDREVTIPQRPGELANLMGDEAIRTYCFELAMANAREELERNNELTGVDLPTVMKEARRIYKWIKEGK